MFITLAKILINLCESTIHLKQDFIEWCDLIMYNRSCGVEISDPKTNRLGFAKKGKPKDSFLSGLAQYKVYTFVLCSYHRKCTNMTQQKVHVAFKTGGFALKVILRCRHCPTPYKLIIQLTKFLKLYYPCKT